MERLPQPGGSAISEAVSDLLTIKSRIIGSWEGTSPGAKMVWIEDGTTAKAR